ncbi:STAS domain-containing protein [Actinoplanes subtropicus]|uniref:STAS domain-containing protein n=1 Tax=Actinoplanes subtropicus TaxID=543632 RepID=UPI0004C2BE64|nr:STAS domain-containing protein [Actinoplanes subtropicus]
MVSVRVLPDEDAIRIRLIGAVDLGSALTLHQAVDRIQEVLPRTVLIDLAGVTFAGSVLAHFLLGIHAAGRHRICLLRAGPTIRMIVTATGIDQSSPLLKAFPAGSPIEPRQRRKQTRNPVLPVHDERARRRTAAIPTCLRPLTLFQLPAQRRTQRDTTMQRIQQLRTPFTAPAEQPLDLRNIQHALRPHLQQRLHPERLRLFLHSPPRHSK